MSGASYRWVIGILVGLLLTLAGGIGGSLFTAGSVAADLENHRSMPAHPVSATRWQDTMRRLDRIEQKQDQIIELLQTR